MLIPDRVMGEALMFSYSFNSYNNVAVENISNTITFSVHDILTSAFITKQYFFV